MDSNDELLNYAIAVASGTPHKVAFEAVKSNISPDKYYRLTSTQAAIQAETELQIAEKIPKAVLSAELLNIVYESMEAKDRIAAIKELNAMLGYKTVKKEETIIQAPKIKFADLYKQVDLFDET